MCIEGFSPGGRKNGSIAVLLAEAGAEAEHELDALEFVEPVLESRGEFVRRRWSEADGAGGAELRAGEGAITIQGAVAEGGAELEVFGEEKSERDAVAGVDADLLGEIAMLIAIDEPQIDQVGAGLGDFLKKRALLDAVAAPDAADDEDFHLAGEAGGKFELVGG